MAPDTSAYASFDIGSGMTKMAIARVEKQEGCMKLKILHEEAVEIHLARDLKRTGTKLLSAEILKDTEVQLTRMATEAMNKFDVPKGNMIGFGTEVFRSAENGPSFLTNISEKIGVRIQAISQNEESLVGFTTGSALYPGSTSKDDLVCWDSGGGSFQLSTSQGKTIEGRLGSAIVCAMMSKLKDLPVTDTLNPVFAEEVQNLDQQIDEYLSNTFPELDSFWRAMMEKRSTKVVGIGGRTCIFSICLHALLSPLNKNLKEPNEMLIKLSELDRIRETLLGKSDQELHNLDFVQREMVVPKLSLMSRVMHKFGIKEVQYVPSNGGCIGYLALELEKQFKTCTKVLP